jgi:hypothetical protein
MKPFVPLSKKEINPWLREEWCIPSKVDAAFVCNMKDVLEVNKQPMTRNTQWYAWMKCRNGFR